MERRAVAMGALVDPLVLIAEVAQVYLVVHRRAAAEEPQRSMAVVAVAGLVMAPADRLSLRIMVQAVVDRAARPERQRVVAMVRPVIVWWCGLRKWLQRRANSLPSMASSMCPPGCR